MNSGENILINISPSIFSPFRLAINSFMFIQYNVFDHCLSNK